MGFMDRFKKKIPTHGASRVTEEKVEPKTKEVAQSKGDSDTGASSVRLTHRIIIRPLVTEKAAVMQAANKYVFKVERTARKPQIKQAIKEVYGVEPLSVHMINVEGKRLRFGRNRGRRSDYKKAIVTVPPGKNIMIHEGV